MRTSPTGRLTAAGSLLLLLYLTGPAARADAAPGVGGLPLPPPAGAVAAPGVGGPPFPPPAGAVAAPQPGGPLWTATAWPLAGTPRPVRRFDPPPQPWLPGHRGVDLAAVPGAEVHAARAGTVLFAGLVAGRPVVTVGHAGGLRTTYEPVQPGLPAGAGVAAGTPIGTLRAGHPGCPAPACLHWGLRRGEDYLDPLALLGLGPVRLLPVEPAAAYAAGR